MINKLQNKNKRAGFTLVEIMIVVAIIALLAAISVPYLFRNREFAQAALVKNDLRLIAAANQQFATDTNAGATVAASGTDLAKYLDPNSTLYANVNGVAAGGNAPTEVQGVSIVLPADVAHGPSVTGAAAAMPDVPIVGTGTGNFFSPYAAQ